MREAPVNRGGDDKNYDGNELGRGDEVFNDEAPHQVAAEYLHDGSNDRIGHEVYEGGLPLEAAVLPQEAEKEKKGEEGKGFECILDVLNPERILLASECVGDARWFIQKSVEYAKNRVVFSRPIGSNQGVQFPIADTYAKLIAAEKVRWSAAEMYDRGTDDRLVGELANTSKYLASECSWQAANVAMDVYGGSGMAVTSQIERKFRETRLYRVAPISQNLVLAYIAQSVLGLPRSY